jgi:hypothetical protein
MTLRNKCFYQPRLGPSKNISLLFDPPQPYGRQQVAQPHQSAIGLFMYKRLRVTAISVECAMALGDRRINKLKFIRRTNHGISR